MNRFLAKDAPRILIRCSQAAQNILTWVLSSFHRVLLHLLAKFHPFWHVHRSFQLLNVPKWVKFVSKSAAILYKINPKLRLLALGLDGLGETLRSPRL